MLASGAFNRPVLTLSDKLRRRSEIAARDIPDGAVLVDMAGGRCWELNKVGAEIWQRLDGSSTLGDVWKVLCARYDVLPASLETDLLELAAALLAQGLLERLADSPPEAPV